MSWFNRFVTWLSTRLLPKPDAGPFPPAPDAAKGNKDDAKVARMEYQLELDKRKAWDKYRYAWSQIVWDKGCFTVAGSLIAGSVLFLGSCTLERYKLHEAARRDLRQQQMAELFKINSAISEVTHVYFKHSGGKKAADEQKVRDEHKSALENAREVINRSPFLFDRGFNEDLDRYYEVHLQMSRLPMEEWGAYKDFARDLSNKFDELCRSVLEERRDDPSKPIRMPLDPISPSEREPLSPKERIELYFKYWKDLQTKK